MIEIFVCFVFVVDGAEQSMQKRGCFARRDKGSILRVDVDGRGGDCRRGAWWK